MPRHWKAPAVLRCRARKSKRSVQGILPCQEGEQQPEGTEASNFSCSTRKQKMFSAIVGVRVRNGLSQAARGKFGDIPSGEEHIAEQRMDAGRVPRGQAACGVDSRNCLKAKLTSLTATVRQHVAVCGKDGIGQPAFG